MIAQTHVGIGLLASIVCSQAYGIPFTVLHFFAVLFGSVFPDIDYEGSIINPAGINPAGINPAGINPAGINPAGINPAGSSSTGRNRGLLAELSHLIAAVFGHRGFFHWPALGLVLTILGLLLGQLWLFWFGWAYTWHIIADSFTRQGVPFFAPFSKAMYGWGAFATGSFPEGIICVVVWWGVLCFGFVLLPDSLQDLFSHWTGSVGLSRFRMPLLGLIGFLLGWQLWRNRLTPYSVIGNRRTRVFHRPDCQWADTMGWYNRCRIRNPEVALKKKYTPCSTCKGAPKEWELGEEQE